MKTDIHPEYHQIEASCVCGNTIMTGSILPEMRLDICSGCHPFYTGQQKLVDREGRVDKFKRRYGEVRKNK